MKRYIVLIAAMVLVAALAFTPSQTPAQSQQLEELSGPAFDQAFLHMMIMHHHMAVVMSEPVAERAAHEELRTLARQIIADQSAEIAKMRAWLRDWHGQAMPMGEMQPGMPMGEPGMGGMMPGMTAGMPMAPGTHVMPAMHPMPGMGMGMEQMGMRDMDMMGLGSLSGARLEAVYMALMVPHHQDAVAMAEQALGRASREEIKQLARSIITTQTAEIQQLDQWLADWYRL